MREILFRGKSKGKPEWEYGYLYEEDSQSFIITSGRHYPDINKEQAILGFLDWFEVFHETVGQFTGLKDCNGKMIFEGDVVKVRGSKKVGEYTTTVVFKRNCFMLDDNKTIFIDNMSLIGVEIIGNIHDNPESLGGK